MLRRAKTRAFAAIAIAGLTVTGLLACTGDDGPTATDSPYLDVDISPSRIQADGTTADISVIATEANGALGEGTVTLRATAGLIDGNAQATLTLANGRATAKYSCNAAEDSNCLGSQKVTAEWNGVTGGARASFVLETPDAGVADAGEPDAGEPDGGVDPGADAGITKTTLSLEASRDRLFIAVGDYAEVTATLADSVGPIAGERISFETTRGGLATTATGTPSATVEATTNGAGMAKVFFFEAGEIGTAQVTATHLPAEGSAIAQSKAKVVVEIVRVRQISWHSTTCSGEECTIMGVKGSGFNEQAQVNFKVVDSLGGPVEGLSVTFAIEEPPSGTTVSGDSITDAEGIVTANVSAGAQIGVFSVKAVVVENEVETQSPSIGIRGAKASNHGFELQCNPVNNTVLGTTADWNTASVEVPCRVKIVDRYNNPVGTMATPVQFKVEAGSIPNAVTTTPYEPGGTNASEGTAEIIFSSMGGTTEPDDVEPLPAAPGQWPFPRAPEPSAIDGSLLRNPRDGLITVIAYVRGEEFFKDDNSNGIHDPGERFIDQGEPFVDANDNGTWDPGELYIDVAPADGQWNPPNGQRDADSTIWTETRLLYTSRPDPRNSYISIAPPAKATTFGTLEKGSQIALFAYFGDRNLNRVQADTVGFNVDHSASKGELEWKSGELLDSYGFGIERRLVNAVDETACTPTTPICRWKLMFYDWNQGYSGYALLSGAGIDDTNPSETDLVTIGAEVLGQELTVGIIGTIE